MRFFGIDLGTTNSVISYATIDEDGKRISKPIVIEQNDPNAIIARRDTTLPSFVYYGSLSADGDNTSNIIVGAFARAQYPIYPDRVAKSIKSQMGNTTVTGLSNNIPDKTPEQVSSRILSHLKKYAEQNPEIRQTIDQVIITVPANFDIGKKEATLKAAETAGFSVRGADGQWKSEILLSEPNAVLYDIAQKYLNEGSVSGNIDFSKNQHIIIIDIGGGTLDVTFQEVRQEPDSKKLEILEIASARYTQLAGDDFDVLTAKRMYDRFSSRMQALDHRAYEDIISRKTTITARLVPAAEDLKKRINKIANNEQEPTDFLWFGMDAEEEDSVTISVDVGNGRQYVDTITKEEYYKMIRPLLGERLKLSDFSDPSLYMEDRENIISPILEVLFKAEQHYKSKGQELVIDNVVLNGGMSKLYWIKKRLSDFFGLEPIITEDPAVSVANGAAIYASLFLSEDDPYRSAPSINIVRHIQNETLYLSLSAGAVERLITEQQELPHTCSFSGYKILPNTMKLELPILKRSDRDHYITIAKCIISLNSRINAVCDLSFDFSFNLNGLLSIAAQVTNGRKKVTGIGSIQLDDSAPKNQHGNRILPRPGSVLHPANELYILQKSFDTDSRRARIADIRLDIIKKCANPEDFEYHVIHELQNGLKRDTYRLFLYHIANALVGHWSDSGRSELKRIAASDRRQCIISISARKLDPVFIKEIDRLLSKLN